MTEPTPAATVILLRPSPEAEGERYRIFFVRRHSKSAFMANAYVFPGGKLDEADQHPDLLARCAGRSLEQAAEILGDVPPTEAQGLYVAALRETFEEAGVLLAEGPDGHIVALSSGELRERFSAYRDQLHRGELELLRLVELEGLTLRVDRLGYWAHWVTPEIERRRFSARFFVTEMPEHQEPVHDQRETTDSAWLSPSEAIARYQRGDLMLPPPTLYTVREMTRFSSMEAVLAEARRRQQVEVRLPVAKAEGSQLVLLLPGDQEYPGSDPKSGRLRRATLVSGRWELTETSPHQV